MQVQKSREKKREDEEQIALWKKVKKSMNAAEDEEEINAYSFDTMLKLKMKMCMNSINGAEYAYERWTVQAFREQSVEFVRKYKLCVLHPCD